MKKLTSESSQNKNLKLQQAKIEAAALPSKQQQHEEQQYFAAKYDYTKGLKKQITQVKSSPEVEIQQRSQSPLAPANRLATPQSVSQDYNSALFIERVKLLKEANLEQQTPQQINAAFNSKYHTDITQAQIHKVLSGLAHNPQTKFIIILHNSEISSYPKLKNLLALKIAQSRAISTGEDPADLSDDGTTHFIICPSALKEFKRYYRTTISNEEFKTYESTGNKIRIKERSQLSKEMRRFFRNYLSTIKNQALKPRNLTLKDIKQANLIEKFTHEFPAYRITNSKLLQLIQFWGD